MPPLLGHLVRGPSILPHWHRDLIRRHWTHPHKQPGRPPTAKTIQQLVLRIATEDAGGYQRIAAELLNLGHRVSPSTIRNIPLAAGLNPAPRRTGPTWTRFLTTQTEGILALDFFHIDTVLLSRIYVPFGIEHATRHWATQHSPVPQSGGGDVDAKTSAISVMLTRSTGLFSSIRRVSISASPQLVALSIDSAGGHPVFPVPSTSRT